MYSICLNLSDSLSASANPNLVLKVVSCSDLLAGNIFPMSLYPLKEWTLEDSVEMVLIKDGDIKDNCTSGNISWGSLTGKKTVFNSVNN